MAVKKKAAPTAKHEVEILKAPKTPKEPKAPKDQELDAVEQTAPEPIIVEPVVLQRDKAPHASASQVAELFTQIEEALAASQGQRQSRPLRWALKSLAMAKETAARHFSLL